MDFHLDANFLSRCLSLTQGLYIAGPGKGSESVEPEGSSGGDEGQHAHQPRDQGERQELLNLPVAGLYAAAEPSDCWTLRSCGTIRLLDSTQLRNHPIAGLYAAAEPSDCRTLRSCRTFQMVDYTAAGLNEYWIPLLMNSTYYCWTSTAAILYKSTASRLNGPGLKDTWFSSC